jgi:hypothetical protein
LTWGDSTRARRALTLFLLVVVTVAGLPLPASAAPGDNVFPRLGAPALGPTFAPVPTLPATAMARTADGSGYFVLSEEGTIQAFGSATYAGRPFGGFVGEAWVDVATTPSGYWALSARGLITSHGNAPFVGGLRDLVLSDPFVAFTTTPAGTGGWALTTGGSVFSFGANAPYLGAPNDLRMRFVDIAATADGYRVVGSDGSVRRYSAGQPQGVVELAGWRTTQWDATAIASSPSGAFWVVAEDGSVMAGGGGGPVAPIATGTQGRVVGADATAGGTGLWVLAAGAGAGGVEISGTVTSSGNGPVGDACVRAYPKQSLFPVAGTRTNPDGTYRLGALSPDTYRVFADDCEGGEYIGEWFPDKERPELALSVDATAGSATANFDLPKGSVLTGSVTDGAGQPLASMCVGAFDAYGTAPGAAPTSTTSITGSYRLIARPGTYEVRFTDCADGSYLGEWYDNRPLRANATPVVLGAESALALKPAALGPAGIVAGVVTNTAGQPIVNACVGLEDLAGQTLQVRRTSITGYYRAAGLSSGSYKVAFNNCSHVDERSRVSNPNQPDYAEEWAGDSPTRAGGAVVDVTAGSTTIVGAELQRGGGVTGVVRRADATPLAGICVDLFDGTRAIGGTLTSTTGWYRFGQLGARDYQLRFNDCVGRSYATEWWADSPTQSGAAAIHGVPEATIAGHDATLDVGGSISGFVRDQGGAGLADVCVTAIDPNGWATSVRTDRFPTAPTGGYRLSGLANTSYKVSFNDCASFPPRGLAQSWYGPSGSGVGEIAQAQPVPIVAGGAVTGIDGTLVPAATVTGVVTNAAGRGIAGVCVRTQHGPTHVVGVTSITGLYSMRGLPAGTYQVQFVDCQKVGYADEWWDDAGSLAGATDLALAAGSSVTGVDAVLAPLTLDSTQQAQATVPAGGTVATSPPTTTDPLQVAATSPDGGVITITEGVTSTEAPDFALLDLAVDVTAPPASVANPLRLSFTLLESALGATSPDAVVVLRDGVPLLRCADDTPGPSVPPPCSLAPEPGTTAGGLATWTFTVLADHASSWQFGVRKHVTTFVAPVDPLPVRNVTKAGAIVPVRFDLGGDLGPDVLVGAPVSTAAACGTGAADVVDESMRRPAAFAYDPATGAYVYSWSTDKKWRKSCRTLTITLVTGERLEALFEFR